MKRIILGLTVIMVAVLAVSCTHSSPKNVAKAYIKAIQKGDAEKAADCFYYEGTDEEKEQSRAAMVAMCQKGMKSADIHQGIKSFDIESVDENGDKAIVHATVTYKDGTSEPDNIATVKKDGKWYIDTDK